MNRLRLTARFALGMLFLMSALPAVGDVQMRSREGQSRLGNRLSRAKSRSVSRSHLVLDFLTPPSADTAAMLSARGMRVVAYLPLTGVLVGFDGEPNLTGLNLSGFDALQPEDKLSPELGTMPAGPRRAALVQGIRFYAVVEFHGDVSVEDRRALVAEAGLEIREHQDLVTGHELVRGTLEQVRELAEWDEVAYIFPASGELVTGLPLIGCLGGATEAGQVGQLTQRVGEGWDGPGLGAAELTYSLQSLTRKLPADQVQAEIQRALAAWSQVVKVNFTRTTSTSGTKNINILFGAKDHGDPYAFDGPGKILAHTFYPAPPNPEPIAGDLHFDDDENWNVGADIDIFSVALHELGHALGLGHSDVPNAVMYPYYRRATALTAEDIGAIRALYAAAEDTVSPGPAAPIAITLTSPANPSSTESATVTLSGSLTGTNGTFSFRWATTHGATGTVTFTANGTNGFLWQATAVPLEVGDNLITLTVSDSANRTVTSTVLLQRQTAPVPPTVPNPPNPPTPPPTPQPPTPPVVPTPVSLDVVSPALPAITVTANPMSANGTVSGGTGRPAVRWSSDRGFSGTAIVSGTSEGKYRWDLPLLALQLGTNNITVAATDTAGVTSSKTFRVTYNAPSEGGPTGGDNTPPRITIVSPNTSFLMTPAYSIALRGTASDTSGVTEVRWECSCGTRGTAQGTSQWSIPNISLPVGTNSIKVFAKDSNGNEGVASLTVFRYEN